VAWEEAVNVIVGVVDSEGKFNRADDFELEYPLEKRSKSNFCSLTSSWP